MKSYSDVFIINSPIQYLLARAISASFCKERPLAVFYKEGGDYNRALADIDSVLGPSPFDQIDFDSALRLPTFKPKRLFIAFRFSSSPIRLFYHFKPEKLCGYEDGLQLYLDHHFTNKRMNDRNPRFIASALIKSFLRVSGIEPDALPYMLRMSDFQEFYSLFPFIAGKPRKTPQYDLVPGFLTTLPAPKSANAGANEALFLSQAIQDDGFVDLKRYLFEVEKLVSDLSLKFDKVFIKPHPRDSEGIKAKLLSIKRCHILPEPYAQVPAEIYLAAHPSTTIYGFVTSAQAYASAFFGSPVFTLAPKFMNENLGNKALLEYWKSTLPILTKAGVRTYQD
jgi:hypothetical protein